MVKRTLTKTTFKLYEAISTGVAQVTNVTVTPSSDGSKTTLNPYGTSEKLLAKNTWCEAVLTTWTQDRAGHRLDQNPSVDGYQRRVWRFKTRG